METKPIRCGCCGSYEVKITPHSKLAKCRSCGATVYLSLNLEDDYFRAMNDVALANRKNFKFDEAIQLYEQLLQKYPDDLSLYEGIFLSRYGVIYEEEGDKLIPTINRRNPAPVLRDEYYKLYMEKCDDAEAKKAFDQRAKYIEQLQNKQKDVEAFDVFISFKAKDDGKTTKDAIIARDLYDELTKHRFNVFMSNVTLKNYISTEFDGIIFPAIDTCKMFILVGTSKEHIESQWVKNEWTRFMNRIKNNDGVSKANFIGVYKDMNPYDFPKINGRDVQYVDAGDLSYLKNVSDYVIQKIKPEEKPRVVEQRLVQRCPHCNATIDANLTVCPECGEPIGYDKNQKSSVVQDLIKKFGEEKDAENKLELVKTYPVPDDEDEIVEFVKFLAFNFNAEDYLEDDEFGELANAIFSKVKQCQQKTKYIKMSRANVGKINGIFASMQDEIKTASKTRPARMKEAKKSSSSTSTYAPVGRGRRFAGGLLRFIGIVHFILAGIMLLVGMTSGVMTTMIPIVLFYFIPVGIILNVIGGKIRRPRQK